MKIKQFLELYLIDILFKNIINRKGWVQKYTLLIEYDILNVLNI